jgi:hypothetical protein
VLPPRGLTVNALKKGVAELTKPETDEEAMADKKDKEARAKIASEVELFGEAQALAEHNAKLARAKVNAKA